MTLTADLLLYITGLCAVAGFSISGSLAAADREQDIISFMVVGSATALGGGTLRDMMLGLPSFWVEDTLYLIVCLIASSLTYLFARHLKSHERLLVWMDALGISLFSVTATAKTLDFGYSGEIAICMGMITACFGGIVRDVLLNRELLFFRPDIYATATLLGSTTYWLLHSILDIHEMTAIWISIALAMGLRSASIIYGLCLPRYKGHHDNPFNMHKDKPRKPINNRWD